MCQKRLILLLLILSLLSNLVSSCSSNVVVSTPRSSKTPAVADEKSKEELITALENLRDAMVMKVDNDVHLTASSFAGVKDYWRSKRWADIFGVPLTILRETIQTVGTYKSLEGLSDHVITKLELARFPYDVTSTVFSISELREAGGELYLGLNGPLYVSAIETMLEEADSTSVTAVSGFSKENYQRVIENYLLGVQGEPVVPVARYSTEPDHQVNEVVNGASQVKVGIKRSFDQLIADIESRPLPDDFPTEQVIEKLVYLDKMIDKSRLESVEIAYPNKKSNNKRVTLGAVSVRHKVWSVTIDNLTKKLDIEIEQEIFSSAGSIVTLASWKFPNDEMINIVDDFAIFMDLNFEIDELYFRVDPEKIFYMQPQEMVLVLPMELSNLWMIADGTVEYLRYLMELPSPTLGTSSTPSLTPEPSITPTPAAKGIIAYEAPEDPGGVWTIHPDGNNKKSITPPHSSLPDWFPDGSQIIYSLYTEYGEREKVYRANPDGSERKKIWELPTIQHMLFRIRVSHDNGLIGQWKIHTGGPSFIGNWGLRYLDLSTFNVDEIYKKGVNQFDVLPSNGRIVFVHGVQDKPFSTSWRETLSVVDSNGKNQQVLMTLEGNVEEPHLIGQWGTLIESPSWAPDGKKIAFYQTKPGDPPDRAALCVINADGTGLHELVTVTLPEASWLSNGDITWSPDGNWIAYVDGGWIWIIDANGEVEPRKLVQGRSPSWALKSSADVGERSQFEAKNVDLIQHLEIEGSVLSVDIRGNYAYLVGDKIYILDITDPANMQMLSSRDIKGLDISVSDGLAYVAGDGLTIIDVTNPQQPVEIGYYEDDYEGEQAPQIGKVMVSENYAYVLSQSVGAGSLQVIDVSDPQNPHLAGSYLPDPAYTDNGVSYSTSYPEGIFISGDQAYITTNNMQSGGFRTLDISNPTNVQEIGALEFPEYPRGVFSKESYAYVAVTRGVMDSSAKWGTKGLGTVDIGDAAQPIQLGFLELSGEPQSVSVSGKLAYVGAGRGGIQVVDVSSPMNPHQVGYLDTPGFAGDITTSNGYAYLADGDGGFFVVQFSVDEDGLDAVQQNTPTPLVCQGAPTPQLSVGEYAVVANDPYLPNKVRSGPGLDQAVISRVQPGGIMKVLSGPECDDGYSWWEVQVLNTGVVGWTAEGDQDNYWLIPCESKDDCK